MTLLLEVLNLIVKPAIIQSKNSPQGLPGPHASVTAGQLLGGDGGPLSPGGPPGGESPKNSWSTFLKFPERSASPSTSPCGWHG